MARKRKSSGSGGASLDSLLDTMTNVVGILVIILIVTQLGVRQAVKRITGLVTVEELEDAKAEAEQIEELLAKTKLEQELKAAEAQSADLDFERVQELIAELEKELAALRDEKIDAARLQKDLEEKRMAEQSLLASIESKSNEIASLKARLAETPQGPDPDAKIVNMPDPRPAPPKAEAVEFMLKGGRLIPMDGLDQLESRALAEISRSARQLGFAPDPDSDKRVRVDADKLKEYFEEKTVADRQFRVKIAVSGGRPQFSFVPRDDDVGIETEKIERSFGTIARRYRDKPVYFRFRVWPDSFETYIAARNVAATLGLTAGWEPYNPNDTYRVNLKSDKDVYVAGYKIPPPRPPQPVDPNRPKPPPTSVVD